MRVLHLDSGREMRGGQRQVMVLLEGLRAAGHDATLACRPGSPLLEAASGANFDVRPLGLLSIASLSRQTGLTHAHDARSHALAALAGARRLVVARRVAFPVSRSPLARWKYSRATHYIAVSEYVKQTLLEAGVPDAKITVVYDGVELGQPCSGGSRVVALRSDDPGKCEHLVRRAARLAGVEVHFSSDLARDLGDAGLFVYLTTQEGLGSAVLAAMAAGVPVVASRVGGLPEAVRDGETGVLTENTPESVAAAMMRVLKYPAFAAALAGRARAVAAERFSAQRMVGDTLRVYERILSC